MSVKSQRLASIATALAAAVPARMVTRSYRNHQQRKNAELTPGLYTVLAGGVKDYPYETADNGIDNPSTTSLGDLRFSIVGQIMLPEPSTGEAIETAELQMLDELENFADQMAATDGTLTLRLLGASLSQQLEIPYGWVYTTWSLPLWED